MRNLYAIIMSVTLLAALPGYASAHATLHHSIPSDGQVVSPAPASVQLTFSKSLEPSFSTARVVDQGGNQVDDGKPVVKGDDNKMLEIGLKPLTAGIYKVIWKIVVLDGHKAKGEFSFTVK